jgi:hypothetical protein
MTVLLSKRIRSQLVITLQVILSNGINIFKLKGLIK